VIFVSHSALIPQKRRFACPGCVTLSLRVTAVTELCPARPHALQYLSKGVEDFAMSCVLCGSGNQAEFTAEMVVHFAGLKNVDRSGVWVFPKLLICLNCGLSKFKVPEEELALLASGATKSEVPTRSEGVASPRSPTVPPVKLQTLD
jgi:hypothetical protein